MALIERLIGGTENKIPVHQFQAIAAEWARGKITSQQAQAAVAICSGGGLTPEEVTEALALIATVPTGTTDADKIARVLRLQEIDQVLLMVDAGLPPYDDPAAVRTRLGI